jgi:hypothetical protein
VLRPQITVAGFPNFSFLAFGVSAFAFPIEACEKLASA